MALPVIRPGMTHKQVGPLKRKTMLMLRNQGHKKMAARIKINNTYSAQAVQGVKHIQKHKKLKADGVVGPKTWAAMGFKQPVVPVRRPVLHGVPYEPGVVAIDGNWVAGPLGNEILRRRREGRYNGRVYSGYRPPWYQAVLYRQAVARYGPGLAGKYVAPPGRSRHGYKDWRGAADVTLGYILDAVSPVIYRPMSYEPWHVQLNSARTAMLPDSDLLELPESTQEEIDELLLVKHGVDLTDITDAADEWLDLFDDTFQLVDDTEEALDDGYDPEQDS